MEGTIASMQKACVSCTQTHTHTHTHNIRTHTHTHTTYARTHTHTHTHTTVHTQRERERERHSFVNTSSTNNSANQQKDGCRVVWMRFSSNCRLLSLSPRIFRSHNRSVSTQHSLTPPNPLHPRYKSTIHIYVYRVKFQHTYMSIPRLKSCIHICLSRSCFNTERIFFTIEPT